MEAMGDVRSVRDSAQSAGKYEVQLDPVLATCETLQDLPRTMGAESAYHHGRHDQRASTSRGLRLYELGALMWNSLRGSPNAKNAGVQVDVAPLEPQRLALSQSKRQSDRVQRLQAIAAGGVEQPSGLFRRQ